MIRNDEDRYKLPTQDRTISVMRNTKSRSAIGNEIDKIVSDEQPVYTQKKIRSKVDEAYENGKDCGLKIGLEEGFEIGLEKGRLEMLDSKSNEEVRLDEEKHEKLKLLSSLLENIDGYFKKLRIECEQELFITMSAIVFEFIEKSLDNKNLVSELIKRNLDEFADNNKVIVEANAETIEEIEVYFSKLDVNSVLFRTNSSMPFCAFNVDYPTSRIEIDFFSYVENCLVRLRNYSQRGSELC